MNHSMGPNALTRAIAPAAAAPVSPSAQIEKASPLPFPNSEDLRRSNFARALVWDVDPSPYRSTPGEKLVAMQCEAVKSIQDPRVLCDLALSVAIESVGTPRIATREVVRTAVDRLAELDQGPLLLEVLKKRSDLAGIVAPHLSAPFIKAALLGEVADMNEPQKFVRRAPGQKYFRSVAATLLDEQHLYTNFNPRAAIVEGQPPKLSQRDLHDIALRAKDPVVRRKAIYCLTDQKLKLNLLVHNREWLKGTEEPMSSEAAQAAMRSLWSNLSRTAVVREAFRLVRNSIHSVSGRAWRALTGKVGEEAAV